MTNLAPPSDPAALRAIHSRMQVAAQRLRLPFRSKMWRGMSGNWLGAGIGSSIDFQDHRPYLPGDDPRYIDWAAFARTGNYTMKLYREEVSPLVDLVCDVSSSMFFDDAKKTRVHELFYFCVESALQSNSSLRAHLLNGSQTTAIAMDALLSSRDVFSMENDDGPPALSRIPFRTGSLRVFISDLLFAGSPQPLLSAMAASKGRGLIFVPFCTAESEPDWSGNLEILDCESKARRVQHVNDDLLTRYHHTYLRHFELWQEHCRKHDVAIARVAAEPDFFDAMRAEALRIGAVELS